MIPDVVIRLNGRFYAVRAHSFTVEYSADDGCRSARVCIEGFADLDVVWDVGEAHPVGDPALPPARKALPRVPLSLPPAT